MDDNLREQLKEKMNRTLPPLDAARAFLQSYAYDAPSMDDIRDDVERQCQVNPRTAIDGLLALEAILAASQEPLALAKLVEQDANRSLDEYTDEAAAAWLRRLATGLRSWLGDLAPAPEHPLP